VFFVYEMYCGWSGNVQCSDTVGHLEAHRACWRGHKGPPASTGSDVHHSESRKWHDERWTTAGLWSETTLCVAVLLWSI